MGFYFLIADLSVKRHCADDSVTDVKISPCKRRTLLNFFSEKPVVEATGFLLSGFLLLDCGLISKSSCTAVSVTGVKISPCKRRTLLNFYSE